MQEPVCHENYPLTTVLVSNLVTLLIYAIGAYLLYRFTPLLTVCYLAVVVILELRLIGRHCPGCYYYGKTCAFGKGRLSALLFKKGDLQKFSAMEVSWKDLLPDFLVFLVPVMAGIVLAVLDFSLFVLIFVIVLVILGFAGNAFVRGNLACRYCRQREIGCPAAQLFDKSQKP